MAKVDLLLNDDFALYSKDLHARLDGHYKDLHHLLYTTSQSFIQEEGVLLRLNAQRAIIAELEAILMLPATYISKDDVKQNKKAKISGGIMETIKRVLGNRTEEKA